ncbi:hypothetical protein D3C76_1642690 [compost metagenome]
MRKADGIGMQLNGRKARVVVLRVPAHMMNQAHGQRIVSTNTVNGPQIAALKNSHLVVSQRVKGFHRTIVIAFDEAVAVPS